MKTKLKTQICKLKITDKKYLMLVSLNNYENEDELLNKIATEINNGTEIINLSTENTSDKDLIVAGRKIRELCNQLDTTFLVEKRADIAYLLEADGIVLDKTSISITDAKKIITDETLIGMKINKEFLPNEDIDFAIIDQKNHTEVFDIPAFVSIDNQNIKYKNKKF